MRRAPANADRGVYVFSATILGRTRQHRKNKNHLALRINRERQSVPNRAVGFLARDAATGVVQRDVVFGWAGSDVAAGLCKKVERRVPRQVYRLGCLIETPARQQTAVETQTQACGVTSLIRPWVVAAHYMATTVYCGAHTDLDRRRRLSSL